MAACLAVAVNGFWIYWTRSNSSPAVLVAFEAGHRQSWEKLVANQQPGQTAYVNGFIPYAPYFQMFFERVDPRRIGRQGVLGGPFHYFDPERTDPRKVWGSMAPGDWLIDVVSPDEYWRSPSGDSLLSPQQIKDIGEPWVRLVQKPPTQTSPSEDQ